MAPMNATDWKEKDAEVDTPGIYPSVYWQPRLTGSVSEQNVFYSYVCLVNTSSPYMVGTSTTEESSKHTDLAFEAEEVDQEVPIEIERSKALHDIILEHNQFVKGESTSQVTPRDLSTYDQSQYEDKNEGDDFLSVNNPNILKLTKMKWLSEGRDGSPDASSTSPSISPSVSTTSSRLSVDSQCEGADRLGDKYLSTIMKLDREHNMFGLSRLSTVSSRPSRRSKRDNRPVFPQTAIVQVCCTRRKCRNRSNTDLPSVLKCGGCRSCMYCPEPVCAPVPPCPRVCCYQPPMCRPSPTCLPGKCCKPGPPKCFAECGTYYGFKLRLNKKPKFEPSPIELTPRSSCVLQLPAMARACTHCPPCQPPSSCFPYLMPCYWPSRSGAPCSVPTRCFHNPACPAPRRKTNVCDHNPPPCPTDHKCADDKDKTKTCSNKTCPGNDPTQTAEFKTKYSKEEEPKRKK